MDTERDDTGKHTVRGADGAGEISGGAARMLLGERHGNDGVRRSDGDWGARNKPQRRAEAAHPISSRRLPGLRRLPPRRRLQRRRRSDRLLHFQGETDKKNAIFRVIVCIMNNKCAQVDLSYRSRISDASAMKVHACNGEKPALYRNYFHSFICHSVSLIEMKNT